MLKHNVEQNSEEWYALRLGLPTASEFKRIITNTGKKSTSMSDYADQLIGEMLLNRRGSSFQGTISMRRGKELEPQAALEYQLTNGVELETVGFCTDDAITMGCSPDRLIVGQNGAIEVKCCGIEEMVGYILTQQAEANYQPQIQGQIHICKLDFVDLKPFHPDLPPIQIRIERNEIYQRNLKEYMEEFQHILAEKKKRMIELGYLDA